MKNTIKLLPSFGTLWGLLPGTGIGSGERVPDCCVPLKRRSTPGPNLVALFHCASAGKGHEYNTIHSIS